MIRTGLKKLDDILGGGLKNGTIIDIFGPSGSGKTQLTLQIAANTLSEGGSILYQDTTGSFRPERLVEILKSKGLDSTLLDNMTVGRITNTAEQINSLSKIESNFSLIIIDNITDLFSFEYSKDDQVLEKTTKFAKYMRQLSQIAREKKIPILIVNMVRKIDDNEQENLDSIISLYTHIKIRMTKNSTKYQGQVFIDPAKKNQFSYTITKEGVTEVTEAI
ncbi:MAG TPA: ATPase domain-containing protein [Candidatus Nitrosotenuis sp.]|nr:ATPase domain-containing protein [Candidatus Nitrosotenuis sp.]